MQGVQRVALERQLEARSEVGGQRIGHAARRGQRLVDQRPQALRRHLLARRVHGREVRGGQRVAKVVRAHLEIAALEASA